MRLFVFAAFVVALSFARAPGAPEAGDGWTDLMKPDVWKKVDDKWIFTDEVKLAPDAKGKPNVRLKADKKDGGKVWVNGETGRVPNLITKEKYGDCEIHVEFLLAKGSNAGVKFNEVYEIQMYDSFGTTKKELTGSDMGGVYPRADTAKGGYMDKGVPPKVNAAKPPGEWQTLDATWKAATFDDKGNKTASAVLVKAVLNGQVIHENVEVKTPTGANWAKKETATGAFMLQTDHGPTAFRNVKIRALK